tara:strand:- start:368 stop:967 length:600 start_codon:yes stop_codon:yes gene_type:complete
LKIITALWGDKYKEDDVRKLPIDLLFSDRTVSGIKTLPINTSYKNTWRKMTLFDSRLDLGECLFLDLDIIMQGDITDLVNYYNEHKIKSKVMLAHVHWFNNKRMEQSKSTYISCNVNSSVFAFNNSECDHIYQELVKYKPKLEMLFEGTDKWFYHKHKDWYQFFPDHMIQHSIHNYNDCNINEAVIISNNGSAHGRNKV